MVDKIKLLCIEKGTDLKNLERVLALGNGTVRRWDQSTPSVDKVLLVSDYFRVPILELFDGNETWMPSSLNCKQKEKAHSRFESELDEKLVGMLKDLTPSEVAQVVSYAEFLTANRKA